MNFLTKLFTKAKDAAFPPPPAFDAVPDQTGARFTFAQIVDGMNENKAMPQVGDVIAVLESDGMGMGVRADTRYRVVGPGPYRNSLRCEGVDGRVEILYPFYMRPHSTVPRFWFDMQ